MKDSYTRMRKSGGVAMIERQLVITPNVRKFIADHFKCPVVVGAELGIIPDPVHRIIDHGHWSTRLFPDDILASILSQGMVLSNLTLSALADSGWYRVN